MATIKDFARMCKLNKNGEYCKDTCPILVAMEDDDCEDCICYITSCTEEAEDIIDIWISEHPVRIYVDDFFEKFPKALKFESGTPHICVNSVYGTNFPCGHICKDCWMNEYKEEEE